MIIIIKFKYVHPFWKKLSKIYPKFLDNKIFGQNFNKILIKFLDNRFLWAFPVWGFKSLLN